MLLKGDKATDFTMPCVRGKEFTLSEAVKNGPILLYFYPVNYGMTCTKYIGLMNEMYDEFEKLGVKIFHLNPGSADDHEKWMDRTNSMYDHVSDIEQKVSNIYDMIITHPEHPKVLGFTNRGFILVDEEMNIRYVWRANRPNDIVDIIVLADEIRNSL
jgi:peroxiredoxin